MRNAILTHMGVRFVTAEAAGHKVNVDKDAALNFEQNHAAAAAALARKLGWRTEMHGGQLPSGDYAFVHVDVDTKVGGLPFKQVRIDARRWFNKRDCCTFTSVDVYIDDKVHKVHDGKPRADYEIRAWAWITDWLVGEGMIQPGSAALEARRFLASNGVPVRVAVVDVSRKRDL